MAKKNTRAAKCPECGKFHLIAGVETLKNEETKQEFMEMILEGFEIIAVTRQEAIDNFGFCDKR